MIYTPRGLKIRFPLSYVFALISKLNPHVDAFEFLQTVEAFENISSLISFITAIIIFFSATNNLIIIIPAIALINILVNILLLNKFNFGDILINLSKKFGVISGFGLYMLILAAISYFTVGLNGIIYYLIAKVISISVNAMINFYYFNNILKENKRYLSLSEINFWNAYNYLAEKYNISTNTKINKDDVDVDKWVYTYNKLALNWPKVVSRFDKNYYDAVREIKNYADAIKSD